VLLDCIYGRISCVLRKTGLAVIEQGSELRSLPTRRSTRLPLRPRLRVNGKVLREMTKADKKVVAEQRRQEVAERRAQEAQTKADRAAEKAR